jgi:hypothetical protein
VAAAAAAAYNSRDDTSRTRFDEIFHASLQDMPEQLMHDGMPQKV